MGGEGGVQTDFKHDLTAKKRNPYGGRGWSSHFFKKIIMGGYRGVRGAVTRSPHNISNGTALTKFISKSKTKGYSTAEYSTSDLMLTQIHTPSQPID